MAGRLIGTAPGGEAAALDDLASDALLNQPGRSSWWVNGWPPPRSAFRRKPIGGGHRCPAGWTRGALVNAALEAGALPNVLPGGRPIDDASAREQTATAWNTRCPTPPAATPRPSSPPHAPANWARCSSAASRSPTCPTPTPRWPRSKPHRSWSAWNCGSAVTELADVVFPVAPVVEKAGSFVNWEGRIRPFEPSLPTNAVPDLRVLRTSWPTRSGRPGSAHRGGGRRGTGPPRPVGGSDRHATGRRRRAAQPGPGEAVLAGWRMLLDAGRLQDGEPYLAGTARTPVVRCRRPPPPKSGRRGGSGHRRHRAARSRIAAGDHRHGRSRGVAAAELGGLGGAPAARGDRGCGGLDRAGRA